MQINVNISYIIKNIGNKLEIKYDNKNDAVTNRTDIFMKITDFLYFCLTHVYIQ